MGLDRMIENDFAQKRDIDLDLPTCAYIYIYIEPMENVTTLFFFSLHPCQTSQVKYRSHTSIYIGCVTGIYYQLGFVQEYLCTLLPARKTN